MEGPLTITEAAPLLRKGELTPSALLEQCLARIDIYEPAVKAWVYLDRERARKDAERLTVELSNGQDRGPLHGIPIGIKDIIDVFDMPTCCGSKLWANSYARKDAEVVARLRQAGAIILGKTVTTPYAYLDPPPTRNPWNLERTPGGSSSGSAAAVACGMCLAALASQTGGSTIRPASYCGVCAFKPTWGRVSLEGVLPLAPSLDHIGIMANCVGDLQIIYEYLTDSKGVSSDLPRKLFTMSNFQPSILHRRMLVAFYDFCSNLHSSGWLFQEMQPPKAILDYEPHQSAIYSHEAASYHYDRASRHHDDYPPRIRDLIVAGTQCDPEVLSKAKQHRGKTREEATKYFYHSYPAIVIPATGDVAADCTNTGNPAWQSPWTYAGMPVVSFPINTSGLPLAVQAIGRPLDDFNLLNIAAQMEKCFARPRRLPRVQR